MSEKVLLGRCLTSAEGEVIAMVMAKLVIRLSGGIGGFVTIGASVATDTVCRTALSAGT